MNKKQIAYQFGRTTNFPEDIAIYLRNKKIPYPLDKTICPTENLFYPKGPGEILNLGIRQLYRQTNQKNLLTENLQDIDRITIEDHQGLESLLSKTKSTKERREWATFLKAHADGKNGVIDEILDPLLAEELSISTNRSNEFGLATAWKKGYNGHHHYHPSDNSTLSSMNYAVCDYDRLAVPLQNWISLLTFNTVDGPEIIGFNRKDTFIPKDGSKKELVRADYRKIFAYLRK